MARFYNDQVIQDGATVFWKLDDAVGTTSVVDATGHGYPGSVSSGVVLGTGSNLQIIGSPGTAASINTGAVNDGISGGQPLPTDNFTQEIWVNPTATTQFVGEAYSGTAGTNSGIRNVIQPTNMGYAGGIGVAVGTNGVQVLAHGSGYLPALLEYATTISGWTHIVVVVINDVPSLYINGALAKTGYYGTNWYYGTAYGSNTIGTGNYGAYYGQYARFAQYPRVLTAAEIQNHYVLSQTFWDGSYTAPGNIRSIRVTANVGAVTAIQSVPVTVTGVTSSVITTDSFAGDVILWLPQVGDVSQITVTAIPGMLVGTVSLTNNDHFDQPMLLSGATGSTVIDFTGATYDEPGEGAWWGGSSPTYSRWFIWTAPFDGYVLFDMQNRSNPQRWDILIWPDTWTSFVQMGYLGNLGAGTTYYTYILDREQVTYNENVRIAVHQGQRYRLRVDDYSAGGYPGGGASPPTTNAVLVWNMNPATSTFVNDNFQNALNLTTNSGTIGPYYYDAGGSDNSRTRIANVTPTSETGEAYTEAGDTLWYKYTATYTGSFEFNTYGSTEDEKYNYYGSASSAISHGMDTDCQVWQTTDSENYRTNVTAMTVANRLARNDDAGSGTPPYGSYNSALTFNVTIGKTYWIQVDFYLGQSGNLYVNWGVPPTPLPGVIVAGAVTVQGVRADIYVDSSPGVLYGTTTAYPAYVNAPRASVTLTSFPGTVFQPQARGQFGAISLVANGGFVSAGQADAGLFLEARAQIGVVESTFQEIVLAIDAFGDNGSNQYERTTDAGVNFAYTPIGLRRAFAGVANEEIIIVGGLQQTVQSDPALSFPLATSGNYGYDWEQRQVPMQDVLSLVDNGFMYVATGAATANSPHYCVATSPDGVAWTGRTSPFTTTGDEVYDCLWTGTAFVAVAPYATGIHVASSLDGVTWSGFKSLPAPPSGTTRRGSEATTVRDGVLHMYVEDTSVTTGKSVTLLRSDNNGSTWTVLPLVIGGGPLNGTPLDVTFVQRLGIYLLVYRDVSGNRQLATSPDGVYFVARTTGIRPQVVNYDSKYVYVGGATGTADRFARSTDGITWTTVNVAAPQVSRLVTYAPRARATFSITWNGTLIDTVTVGPGWSTLGYNVFFSPTRSDLLTLTLVAGYVEIRRIRAQEAVDAFLFGAFPQGQNWAVSALDGAFGQPFEMLLTPNGTKEYSAAGYVTNPGPGLLYFDRAPAPVIVIPQTEEGEAARIRFIPNRYT